MVSSLNKALVHYLTSSNTSDKMAVTLPTEKFRRTKRKRSKRGKAETQQPPLMEMFLTTSPMSRLSPPRPEVGKL
jgi:hypothetical protein